MTEELSKLKIVVESLDAANAASGLERLDLAATSVEASTGKMERKLERTSKTTQRMTKGMDELVKRLRAVRTIFLSGLAGTALIRSFTSIEDGLVGVAKTSNLTEKEMAQLERRFQTFALTSGVPNANILKLLETSGQLGVRGVANISKFGETLAKLEKSAPSIAGPDAALSLTRVLNLTGEGTAQIEKIANVVVGLGNQTSALESEIVRASQFAAQAVAPFRLASENVVALGTSFVELGLRSETASTATARSFNAIARAAAKNSGELEAYARVAGLTKEAFGELAKTAPLDAFLSFIEGIGKVPTSELSDTLKDLSLDGLESIKAFGALGIGAKLVARNIADAGEIVAQNSALNTEYDRSNVTLTSSFVRLANAVGIGLASIVGDATGLDGVLHSLNEAAVEVIKELTGVGAEGEEASEGIKQLTKAVKVFTVVITALGAATLASKIIAVGAAAGSAASLLGPLIVAFATLSSASTDLGGSLASVFTVVAATKIAPYLKTLTQVSVRTRAINRLVDQGAAAHVSSARAAKKHAESLRLLSKLGAASAANNARGSFRIPTEAGRRTVRNKSTDANVLLVRRTNAVAKATQRLAKAQQSAAVGATVFSRATFRAGIAVKSLKGVIAANPLGALVIGLSLVLPLLGLFTSKAKEAVDTTKELKKANEDLAQVLESLSQANAEQESAVRTGNIDKEVGAIKRKISILEAAQVAVVKLQTAEGAKGTKAAPDGLVLIDNLEASGVSEQALRDLTVSTSIKVAAALQEALFDVALSTTTFKSVPKIQLPVEVGVDITEASDDAVRRASEKLLTKLGQELSGQSFEGFKLDELFSVEDLKTEEVKAAAEDLVAELRRISASARFGDEDVLIAFDIRLTELLDKVAQSIPGNTVFAQLKDEINENLLELEAATARLEKQQDSAGFTQPEREAQGDINKIKAALEAELLLAAAQTAEAAKLLELRTKLDALGVNDGLSREDSAAEIDLIVNIQKRVDALLEERKVRTSLAKTQKEAQAELREHLDDLARETDLIGKNADEIEKLRAVQEALDISREAGNNIAQQVAVAAEVAAEITERQKLKAAVQEQTDAMRELRTEATAALSALDKLEALTGRTQTDSQESAFGASYSEDVSKAIVAVRNFEEEHAGLVASFQDQINAIDQLSSASDEQVAAQDRAALGIIRANAALDQFKAAQVELVSDSGFAAMAKEAEALGLAYDKVFRTDSQNEVVEGLNDIHEAALKALRAAEFKFSINADPAEFDAAKDTIQTFVTESEMRLRDLAKVEDIREAAESIGQSFGDAYTDMILGAATAEEAARNFARNVGQILLDKLIVQPAVEQLTSMITAFGSNILGTAGATAGGGIATGAATAASLLTQAGIAVATAITTAAATAATLLSASGAAQVSSTSRRGNVFGAARGTVFGRVDTFARGGLPRTKHDTARVVGAMRGQAFKGRVIPMARGEKEVRTALKNVAPMARGEKSLRKRLSGVVPMARGEQDTRQALKNVTPMMRGQRLDRGTSATVAAEKSVRALMAGDVVSEPTLMPQALIGEGARPEAVMPLDKTTQGALGVMASIMTPMGKVKTTLGLERLSGGNLGVSFDLRDIAHAPVSPEARGAIHGSSVNRFRSDSPSQASFPGSQPGASSGQVVDQRTYNTKIVADDPNKFRNSQQQLLSTFRRT